MANLYLTEQGSVLRKRGDRLIVEKDDAILLDVECHKIDAVLVFGNVQFTTQSVKELFEHGIEMAILTKTGRLIGQITSPCTKNIELRIIQFKRHYEEDFKISFSRNIVQGKIRNSLQFIRGFYYNHPEIDLIEEMNSLESVQRDIAGCNSFDVLNGFEGMAALLRLQKVVNEAEDSIRVYALCGNCEKVIRIIGQGEVSKEEKYYIL